MPKNSRMKNVNGFAKIADGGTPPFRDVRPPQNKRWRFNEGCRHCSRLVLHVFGSKEEIYYELILEEEQRIRNAVLDLFPPENVCSKESIKRFLLYSLGMMDESPLLRQMMDRGEMELLFRKLPKDLLERNFTEDQDALLPVITAWQKAGILPGTAPESIVGMIRSMALLTLHKKRLEKSNFHQPSKC